MLKLIFKEECSFQRYILKFSEGINSLSQAVTDFKLHAKMYILYQNTTFILFHSHNSKNKHALLQNFVAAYRKLFGVSRIPLIVA